MSIRLGDLDSRNWSLAGECPRLGTGPGIGSGRSRPCQSTSVRSLRVVDSQRCDRVRLSVHSPGPGPPLTLERMRRSPARRSVGYPLPTEVGPQPAVIATVYLPKPQQESLVRAGGRSATTTVHGSTAPRRPTLSRGLTQRNEQTGDAYVEGAVTDTTIGHS